ncbi:fused isobutyryl-CoA mutase/GTPase IcmF [Alteribacillus iranensis]|uniref:Fused isobutyryl-CoA mutase n=1 Tax=Alteribacillus iranensis TaxID=930128 RepID=A0A1I2D1P0_9BACI|nr:fused isobutyryl-CoA mutase/GTPase IcmF [Alteribacillus iranensis]SFE74395.1 methylmalonyl-CoA mutase [Alteribacillus iranensis]
MVSKGKRANHPIRFITAAALFDGHDASINIIRRLLQASGVEVIHLGHNRSVEEVVNAAIQEHVQGIAISTYQGGHVEFLKYMYDLLQRKEASHIQIFAGGGGVITSREREELMAYGINRVFSPEDGRKLGLQGMIDYMIQETDFPAPTKILAKGERLEEQWGAVAASITKAEERQGKSSVHAMSSTAQKTPVLGITGTGGAGKSSLTDELVRRYLNHFQDRSIAILSIDPSKKRTGGALLGDRIRMNAVNSPRVYMRSLATRHSKSELSTAIKEAIQIVKEAGYDLVIVETSGIGQGDTEITDVSDLSMYVMTSEYGTPMQLEKIEMIDVADIIVINKFERRGSEDALRDVRKQVQRARQLFDVPVESLPVFGTIASQFNDEGTNELFAAMMKKLEEKVGGNWSTDTNLVSSTKRHVVLPPERTSYLGEIVHTVRDYHHMIEEQVERVRKRYALECTKDLIQIEKHETNKEESFVTFLDKKIADVNQDIDPLANKLVEEWRELKQSYQEKTLTVRIRNKEKEMELYTESLSGTLIPRISLPTYKDPGDILRWRMKENLPGYFPYTAGVFPLKRKNEDPTRQFAGEGTPDRTNKRFHYLCEGTTAKRLSTAFDSVTLYGHDPEERPDIYGKIGNSGVNVCTLDDMKKLFSGFDLCDPSTSVSMTINGPAPIILAMFLNTAIDQQVKKWKEERKKDPTREEYNQLKEQTMQTVRGTVQADILKEDQGQNTCIFSTEFALRMMGDIQQYFIDHHIRNYYSVSISGYHMAEAGANPITQLAFTLANGFTYVEYYLSRGMSIDDFAPNLSFFFSNGLDPEYAVMGRVARRIWAIVIKNKYGGNERSQKLKYHIQTSGRSLHAQEMDFNDIRTTLQALIAMYDHCNSLHTNAYDEAYTTPTEQSVRRAMAIQMIIDKEYGLTKNENPLQGAFIIEELTDLVEEAVLKELMRLHDRGGVLGAMETQYQRGKIQEESLYYEQKKHSGALPIVGVNTFMNPNAEEAESQNMELARSSKEEKDTQIEQLRPFQKQHENESSAALKRLQQVALNGGNIFEALMETVKKASLGQITTSLYEVGGQYRRNM